MVTYKLSNWYLGQYQRTAVEWCEYVRDIVI